MIAELTFENLELSHRSSHFCLFYLLFPTLSKKFSHIRSIFVLVLRYSSVIPDILTNIPSLALNPNNSCP